MRVRACVNACACVGVCVSVRVRVCLKNLVVVANEQFVATKMQPARLLRLPACTLGRETCAQEARIPVETRQSALAVNGSQGKLSPHLC